MQIKVETVHPVSSVRKTVCLASIAQLARLDDEIGGLRRYGVWLDTERTTGPADFLLNHRREDGAALLASKVLDHAQFHWVTDLG